MARRTADERFWCKVAQSGDCWVWIGAKNTWGYGNFYVGNGLWARAHRYAYERLRAEIPDGLQLDHLCRDRACVNPWHLEPVTGLVNTRRGEGPALTRRRRAAIATCKAGHPLSGGNLYVHPKTGYRYCRECQRGRDQAYKNRIHIANGPL